MKLALSPTTFYIQRQTSRTEHQVAELSTSTAASHLNSRNGPHPAKGGALTYLIIISHAIYCLVESRSFHLPPLCPLAPRCHSLALDFQILMPIVTPSILALCPEFNLPSSTLAAAVQKRS